MFDSLPPHGLQPARLFHPWDFSGKNTGVGCHFPLQGILATQGLNPHLLHCKQILNRWATGEAYRYTYIPSFLDFLPFKSPQSNEQGSLSYMVGSHYLPILYIVSIVYIWHLYINGQAIGSSFQSCYDFSSVHCIQRVFSKTPHCSKDKTLYSFKRPKHSLLFGSFIFSLPYFPPCPTTHSTIKPHWITYFKTKSAPSLGTC